MRQRTDRAIVLTIYALFFIGMTLRAWWDFTHPREWATAGDDPHVYSWFIAGVFLLCVFGFGFVFISERRVRRRNELIAWLLSQAEHLIREKRLEEAEVYLNEAKELTLYKDR